MTFTEAALAVLEREGRPMHSREIAEKAVELGILSHVGKTPVQTMSARLSTAVAKGREKGPFARIRPGVFALIKWEGKAPGPSKEAEEKPKEVEKKREPRPSQPKQQQQPQQPSQPKPQPQESAEALQQKKKKRRRRKKRPEEVGADLEQKPKTSAAVPPPATQTVASAKAPGAASKGPRGQKSERISAERASSSSAEKIKTGPTAVVRSVSQAPPKVNRTRDIVDQIEDILRTQTRPLSAAALAEQTGRASGDGIMLVEALIVADGLDRESRGLRPRFVEHRSGFALAAREVSDEILALERQVVEAKERLVRIAERQILRRLRSLPKKMFVQIMTVHLQRSGFEALVSVERNRREEFHLSVQDRRRSGRFRTAVVLSRDPADYLLPDRAVVDLRGALHHYDATSGMIITTGAVGEQARAEAFVPNLPPVALVDGEMLSRDMVRLGIGVRNRSVALPAFDEAFFASLES